MTTTNLYVDTTFPCSLNLSSTKNINEKIVWKRPHEIVANPKLFAGNKSEIGRLDVVEGLLNDSWFLVALINLVHRPDLIRHMIVTQTEFNSKNYNGSFVFRFYSQGKWVEVKIDDRLPTLNNKLLFARSSINNSFWYSLLEKAYAKFRKSYRALESGSVKNALKSFTGGTFYVLESERLIGLKIIDLVSQQYHDNKIIYLCSFRSFYNFQILGNRHHSVYYEGYAINAVEDVKVTTQFEYNERLVRIKNPWSKYVKWNGHYSDGDKWEYVSDEIKNRIGFKSNSREEFWMTNSDFLSSINTISVFFIENPSDQKSGISNAWFMSSLASPKYYGPFETANEKQSFQIFIKSEFFTDFSIQTQGKDLTPNEISIYKWSNYSEPKYKIPKKDLLKLSDFDISVSNDDVVEFLSEKASSYIVVPHIFENQKNIDSFLYIYSLLPFSYKILRAPFSNGVEANFETEENVVDFIQKSFNLTNISKEAVGYFVKRNKTEIIMENKQLERLKKLIQYFKKNSEKNKFINGYNLIEFCRSFYIKFQVYIIFYKNSHPYIDINNFLILSSLKYFYETDRSRITILDPNEFRAQAEYFEEKRREKEFLNRDI